MSEVARSMTKQEMWDFLDREGILLYVGEGWVFNQNALMKKVNECDCLACQSIRALLQLGFKVQIHAKKDNRRKSSRSATE